MRVSYGMGGDEAPYAFATPPKKYSSSEYP
jgi:hypothetical protein